MFTDFIFKNNKNKKISADIQGKNGRYTTIIKLRSKNFLCTNINTKKRTV